MQIRIAAKPMGDGSNVYDVILQQDDQRIELPAISIDAAQSMVTKLVLAVTAGTNETVEVRS